MFILEVIIHGFTLTAAVIFTLFFPLILQLIVLYHVSQTFMRQEIRVLGFSRAVYFTCLGTVIHEASHFLACLLSGTPVGGVKLFSPRESPPGSGNYVLGYVEHAEPGFFGKLLIGTAPFFGVTLFVAGAAALLLPGFTFPSFPFERLSSGDLGTLFGTLSFLGQYLKAHWDCAAEFFRRANLIDWRTWVFFYLMLAVLPGAAPSAKDLALFLQGMAALLLLLIPANMFFYAIGVDPLKTPLAAWLFPQVAIISSWLGFSIALSLLGLFLFFMAGILFRRR